MRFDPDRVLADAREPFDPAAFAARLARAGLDVSHPPPDAGLVLGRYPTENPAAPRVVLMTRCADRTGPAFLVELARAWPKALAAQVEGVFAAAPRYRAIRQALSAGTGRTLSITLDAPGVGAIFLIGRGTVADLAVAAARDLWIPHRSSRPLVGSGGTSVVIRGARDGRPPDHALLAATAQLVTELALRWAKADPSGR